MSDVTEAFFGFFSRRPVIYAVAAFWILTNALMFPLLLKLWRLSGSMIPDVLPVHDARTLSSIFSAYGTEGMAAYARIAFLDFFYPAGYALFFGSAAYLLWKDFDVKHFAWLPVLAALIDYAENHYLGRIAADVSDISAAAASLTGTLVLVKLVLIGITVLIISAGIIRKFTSKKSLGQTTV